MATEMVKMSSKGQLVVPEEIRKELGLSPGERFVAFSLEDGVYFKKVNIRFDEVKKMVRRRFRSQGITKKEIAEAVRWARKS
jgi:AbrB family looped-hinge helix DNA binding protein